MKKSLKKWLEDISPKDIAGAVTVVYVVTLIPLLIIARYNFPSADDYSFGDTCRSAWLTTHSVGQVLKEAILLAWESYFDWMGSFTSEVLSALHPAVFGERWYFLTTWIMLGMISFSTAYLLRNILVKVFQADKYTARIVIMLVLFVSIQCQTLEGRVEAYYWYCGSVRYIFLHSMSLFYYGLLIQAACNKGKKRRRDLAAASVLGFFVGGGNQMTALNVAIVLCVAMGFMLYSHGQRAKRTCLQGHLATAARANTPAALGTPPACCGDAGSADRKKYGVFWIPIGFFYLGFILSSAAPGNWVRTSQTAGMGMVKSVLISFHYCLEYVLGEWTGWPVLLLAVTLVPLFWHIAERTEFSFRYPVWVVLFGFCLVSAMITPPLFAVGNIMAGRLQALIFLMYILVLTLCVGYVTGWARKQWDKGRERRQPGPESIFSPNTVYCLIGCGFFFLAASGLSVVPNPHYYAYTSAITDLRNNSAKEYAEALARRVELYNSDASGILEVDPLPAYPALLYFSDITSDVDNWENRALARFYGKDGVVVKTDL